MTPALDRNQIALLRSLVRMQVRKQARQMDKQAKHEDQAQAEWEAFHADQVRRLEFVTQLLDDLNEIWRTKR